MVGLRMFEIKFDNPTATYFAGQVVSGCVKVALDKEKTMRGIKMKFQGRAEVKWKVSRTVRDSDGKSRRVTDTYSAHEQYLENEKYLVGSGDGDMVLPIGEHVFPFSMHLPNNIPSSFEGEYGFVRYTVKVKMNRPWKFDHDAKVVFTVISHLDLNVDPRVKEPCQVEQEKYICCCCCQSGPITLVANVPVTGYVPGQDIPVTIEVDNASDETLSTVSYKLEKTIKFHGSHGFSDKTKHDKDKVAEQTTESIGPHGTATWTLKLKVPSLPPSYLNNCNIIDIDYNLSVKGVLNAPHSNMHLNIPIVIGTIPLASFFPNMVPGSVPVLEQNNKDLPPSFNDVMGAGHGQPVIGWSVNPSTQPSGNPSAPNPPTYPPAEGSSPYPTKTDPYAPPSIVTPYPPADIHGTTQPSAAPYPPGPSFSPLAPSVSNLPSSYAPSAPFEQYPDMPPPTYEESVLGKRDVKEHDDTEHTQGDRYFAPRYPMYQFN